MFSFSCNRLTKGKRECYEKMYKITAINSTNKIMAYDEKTNIICTS